MVEIGVGIQVEVGVRAKGVRALHRRRHRHRLGVGVVVRVGVGIGVGVWLRVYAHCLDRLTATGTLVMCLRKLQRWALPPIVAEYSRFDRRRLG